MAVELASHEARFRAMGSDAHVVVVGAGRSLLAAAVRRIERLEQLWSRFVPDSDVSTMNRHAGRPIAVDESTFLLVDRAVEAWRVTGGLFDPTVLGDVLRAGYVTSFAADRDRPDVVRRAGDSALVVACTDIELDPERNTVTLPAGTGFDAGGIGKGLAADVVATDVMAAGAAGACVNLGGDLRVEGLAPDGGPWTIGVEHPRVDEPIATLSVAGGAVATSTTLRRRWTVDGEARHHLIDPFTGAPSTTDVELMTVVAGQAWTAEVLAKAGLLRGSQRMFDLYDATAHALAVSGDGSVHTTAGLAPFLVWRAPALSQEARR